MTTNNEASRPARPVKARPVECQPANTTRSVPCEMLAGQYDLPEARDRRPTATHGAPLAAHTLAATLAVALPTQRRGPTGQARHAPAGAPVRRLGRWLATEAAATA